MSLCLLVYTFFSEKIWISLNHKWIFSQSILKKKKIYLALKKVHTNWLSSSISGNLFWGNNLNRGQGCICQKSIATLFLIRKSWNNLKSLTKNDWTNQATFVSWNITQTSKKDAYRGFLLVWGNAFDEVVCGEAGYEIMHKIKFQSSGKDLKKKRERLKENKAHSECLWIV